MKKQQFLKRCETIYNMGLGDESVLELLDNWADAVMRFGGGQQDYPASKHQLDYWKEFVEKERKRTNNFAGNKTLANDIEGYKIIQIAAILSHPCQKCAEDTQAWHTRRAFCNHNQ